MKIRLMRQPLKKATALVMAVAMTASCVGILTPKEVKASEDEWAFEEDFEGNCGAWKFWQTGEIVQSPDNSKNKVLKMNFASDYPLEAAWGVAIRDITLKPNTSYIMEVKVRGDNISASKDFKDGVHVNLWGNKGYPMDFVNDFKTESFGWCTMQVYFYTTSTGLTTIQCGLDNVRGTAYFDDIRIKEYTYTAADEDKRIIKETDNIRLSLTPETLETSGISQEKLQQLLEDLQSTYKAYYDLTGSAPYYGDTINMLESFRPVYLKYGAVSGNPIHLSGSQVSALKLYMEKGCVNFGWLHEIGHDFDNGSDIKEERTYNYGWDFHDEFWANTKMLYVLDNTDVSTNIDGLTADTMGKILQHYKKNYDKWHASATGEFDDSYHDALTYIFGTIIQDIGWDPFVKTFHQYTAEKIPEPVTGLAKLERFLYAVQQNYNPAGNEVMENFRDGEYEAVRKYYFNLEYEANEDLEARKSIADEAIMKLVGDEEYPEVIQAVIDSEKKHVDYAGCQEELDDIIENVEAVLSPITVSYKDYKGDTVTTREVKPGDEIPTDVTLSEREYYTFGGWYMDQECTVPVSGDSTATLEKDITVCAGWKPNHYTVVYELNGGTNSDLNPVDFTVEDDIIVFESPEREGYLFDGWYRSSDFKKRIYDFEPKDFSSRVLESFTVYAKWKEKPATPTPEPTATATPEPTATVTPNPTATVAPTKVVTPTVAPKKISVKKAVVAKVSTQYYYDKAVKPELKITYQGNALKKDKDYKLSYKNNKKAGTGKIIITGKGDYTGTKTVTFKIVNGYAKYKVVSKVGLYKSASNKSKKVTTLSKGKVVKVYVDSEVKDTKKRNWVKVKAGNKTGYVLKKKLKKMK